MKKMSHEYFLHKVVALMITLLVLVDSQNDPSGFINIDCGIPENTTSYDAQTKLTYTSDASYITGGVIHDIPSLTDLVPKTLRTFPEGTRNCYNISLSQGKKYLVKAAFFYGNYDKLNQPPVFDLYLGATKWANVQPDTTSIFTEEIIHVPSLDYIFICLVNLGTGDPFISAIEVRDMTNNAYVTPPGVSLVKIYRKNLGSSDNETVVRYSNDPLDREWYPYNDPKWNTTTTRREITSSPDAAGYQLPWAVMNSAVTPANPSEPLTVSLSNTDCTRELYVYAHFAELRDLVASENRTLRFDVEGSADTWTLKMPNYLASYTLDLTSPAVALGTCEFSITMVKGATLPPFCNAFEFYYAVNDTLLTDQADAYAMVSIKTAYNISRNWQGDPCAPEAYAWEGVTCRYKNGTPPVVISLNLSSSQLIGQIDPRMSSLKNLQSLDLSYNRLIGPIPKLLSQLISLKVLNLTGNNLNGSVPATLLAKSQDGSLSLNVSGNPDLCQSSSCSAATRKKGKINVVLLVVVTVVVVLVLAAALALLLLRNHKRKKHQQALNITELESKNRQVTYSDILKITNNFDRVLGKGGFGAVYYGYMEGTPVAVKMLSPSSAQGYKEFQAEVKLLLRVHHRNLTSLVGYCNEDSNLGLVYEYMANGDLEYHLSKNNPEVQNWERRLQIAHEAAQGKKRNISISDPKEEATFLRRVVAFGPKRTEKLSSINQFFTGNVGLEYLHRGCKPQIVHRDIKTTNILLNDQFHAKLADFGLSRAFPTEGGTHVSATGVAGTPGYLDPEYYATNWLTEKSDVYSFGVVLLETITGRPVIAKAPDRTHISMWVQSMLENGDIKGIIDPRLSGDFDVSSVWKIVELAMACVSHESRKRPMMTQVVTELNECLEAETARAQQGMSIETTDSGNYISSDFHIGTSPLLR